jgi:hypothetical protein
MKVSINHQKEGPQALATSDGKTEKARLCAPERERRAAKSHQSAYERGGEHVGRGLFAAMLATLADHRSAQSIQAILTLVVHPSTIPRPYYHF